MRADDAGRSLAAPRFLFWLALIASWLVLLPLLWSAFSDVPSPERLQQQRTVGIPTLATLGWTIAKSFAELTAVLALAWPRGRWYAARLWAAAIGLAAWFVYSTPLGITKLEWVHRRWLAAVIVSLVVAGAAAGVARVVRARRVA